MGGFFVDRLEVNAVLPTTRCSIGRVTPFIEPGGPKTMFIYCLFFYSGIFAKRETSLCLGGEKEKDALLALSFLLLSSSLTS